PALAVPTRTPGTGCSTGNPFQPTAIALLLSAHQPPMAMLVLSARTAWTRLVAADLRLLPHEGLCLGLTGGNNLGGLLVGTVAAGAGMLELHLGLVAALLLLDCGNIFLRPYLHPREHGDHLPLEVLQHLREHQIGRAHV